MDFLFPMKSGTDFWSKRWIGSEYHFIFMEDTKILSDGEGP